MRNKSADAIGYGCLVAFTFFLTGPLIFLPMAVWRRLWPVVERHVPRPRLAIFVPSVIGVLAVSILNRTELLWPLVKAVDQALGIPIHRYFPGPFESWFVGLEAVLILIGVLLTIFAGPLYVFVGILWRRTEIRTSHGTARWAEFSDVRDAFLEDGYIGGLMLGRMTYDVPKKIDPRYRAMNHVLTCAPTGSGKGIGCVIPNLLEYPGSCFVLDVKGENWAVTQRMRREREQTVITIDPFGVTGERGHSVDLFAAIKPTSEECVSEAAALVDTLVVRSGNTGENHWDDSAANLLQGLVLHVSTLEASKRHLGTVREFITWPEPKLLELLENLGNEPAAFGLIARAANAFLAKADRERSGVLSTAQRHTAFLDDPRVSKTLRCDAESVDFTALKHGAMSVFLCIPPDKLEPYRGYARAIIGSALKAMVRERFSSDIPVLFLVDEMAQLGYFKPLEDGISLLRGYGVWLWLLVQDLSQLQAVYPRWRSFLANASLQVFGTQDIDTARYVSAMLGQETIEVQSSSSSRSYTDNGSSSSDSVSTSAMGRALLTPDEVRRLDRSRVLVLEQGRLPVMLQRLNYLSDKESEGFFDSNPMYAARV